MVSNSNFGTVTSTITVYKDTVINGTVTKSEQINWSLLPQNDDYSPTNKAYYSNSWGGNWEVTRIDNSNQLKIRTLSTGSNPSGGVTVRIMPGTSYAGTTLNLYLTRS